MTYITVKQAPMYHQITMDELLFGDFKMPALISANTSNTKTYAVERVSDKFLSKIDVIKLVQKLQAFNNSTAYLREVDRKTLYDFFSIPKHHGGFRKISAPKPELMSALRLLKGIFEQDFGALYHTTAFAYIHGRSTIDAVKRHQSNESRWFGKFDLHDFFGSTTLEFVMKMFSQIFPFSEIVQFPAGKAELEKALELAFLDGGLPQGTPISPLITNIMMIPVDYKLSNTLRDFHGQKLIYTRYADDFIISSRTTFSVGSVQRLIMDTLHEFGATFSLNTSKTRYGSSAGQNWNLGVMLNKDNQITVGYKRKRQFQSMLYNYITDRRNGRAWSREDIQTLQGLFAYYRMVERDNIDAIIDHVNRKLHTNVLQCMKQDLA